MKSSLYLVAAMTSVICASVGALPASAQPPRVRHADIDYEASGFVMPASGQMPPGAIAGLGSGGPMRAPGGYASQAGPGYVPPLSSGGYGGPAGYAMPGAAPVQQVGFFGGGSAGCDSCGTGGCDGMHGSPMMGGPMMYSNCGGACGGACGGSGACGMGGACGTDPGCILGSGGVLGKMYGSQSQGMSGAQHFCMFCRGEGCEACQMFSGQALLGALGALMPYTEGGRCAQRWYDVSAEALFLGRTTRGSGVPVITQRGSGPGGTPVLFGSDGIDGDIEAGVRLSGAFIFGAGGSLEATYMGGHEWNDSATASSPAEFVPDAGSPTGFSLVGGADLFSFLTDFGTIPPGGVDDVDRSVSQTLSSSSNFHSGEFNYRRRTVGPSCRFQGSWLFGMRYFRYDNRLGLNIDGLNDDGTGAGPTDGIFRFFDGNESVTNDLFGAQIGGDLWWNITAGINFGVGMKAAWLKNEARAESSYFANSLNAGAPGSFTDSRSEDDGTLATELQVALVYRLSHSWSFRSAYYMIAIDEVATARFDRDFILDSAVAGESVGDPGFEFDSLTLSGFSFGAEYLW